MLRQLLGNRADGVIAHGMSGQRNVRHGASAGRRYLLLVLIKMFGLLGRRSEKLGRGLAIDNLMHGRYVLLRAHIAGLRENDLRLAIRAEINLTIGGVALERHK